MSNITKSIDAVDAFYLLDGEYDIDPKEYGELLIAAADPNVDWEVHAECEDGYCRLVFMDADEVVDYKQNGGSWRYEPVQSLLRDISIHAECGVSE